MFKSNKDYIVSLKELLATLEKENKELKLEVKRLRHNNDSYIGSYMGCNRKLRIVDSYVNTDKKFVQFKTRSIGDVCVMIDKGKKDIYGEYDHVYFTEDYRIGLVDKRNTYVNITKGDVISYSFYNVYEDEGSLYATTELYCGEIIVD